jgi:hypothetical protein
MSLVCLTMSFHVDEVIIAASWHVVKEVQMGVLGRCKFGGSEAIVTTTF